MICVITDEKTSHFHSDALNLQTGTIIQGHNNTKNGRHNGKHLQATGGLTRAERYLVGEAGG